MDSTPSKTPGLLCLYTLEKPSPGLRQELLSKQCLVLLLSFACIFGVLSSTEVIVCTVLDPAVADWRC